MVASVPTTREKGHLSLDQEPSESHRELREVKEFPRDHDWKAEALISCLALLLFEVGEHPVPIPPGSVLSEEEYDFLKISNLYTPPTPGFLCITLGGK